MAETYREIQVTETDSGAPVTSELMEALRANLIAVIEGASGAPRVQSSGIDIGTSSVSGSISGGSSVDIELDSLSFFPSIVTDPGASPLRSISGGSAAANEPKFNIQNTGSSSRSYDVAWRFIA